MDFVNLLVEVFNRYWIASFLFFDNTRKCKLLVMISRLADNDVTWYIFLVTCVYLATREAAHTVHTYVLWPRDRNQQ